MAEDLWPQFLRVVADAAPWLVFAENVTRKAIDAAADDLESLGYEARCISVSAEDLGADHVRQRYWLLAHANVHSELLRTLNAEVAERAHLHPRIWKAYPDEPRMADGMGHRVDRLEATGNGQVPCVAAAAFATLAAALP